MPKGRTAPKTGAKPKVPRTKFKRDIIIASDDGHLYYMTPKDLRPYRVSPKEASTPEYQAVRQMIGHGVAVAAIPEGSETEGSETPDVVANVVVTCYLMNLASLKKHTRYEK
jgi:hypothetical protein